MRRNLCDSFANEIGGFSPSAAKCEGDLMSTDF